MMVAIGARHGGSGLVQHVHGKIGVRKCEEACCGVWFLVSAASAALSRRPIEQGGQIMKRIIGMLIAASGLAFAAAPAHAEERHPDRDGQAWHQEYRRDDRGRRDRDQRDRDRYGDRGYRWGGEVVYRADDCRPAPEPRQHDRHAAIDAHAPRIDVQVGIGEWLARKG
jgi:hypothetical protein